MSHCWQPLLCAVHKPVYNMLNGDRTPISVTAGCGLVLMASLDNSRLKLYSFQGSKSSVVV